MLLSNNIETVHACFAETAQARVEREEMHALLVVLRHDLEDLEYVHFLNNLQRCRDDVVEVFGAIDLVDDREAVRDNENQPIDYLALVLRYLGVLRDLLVYEPRRKADARDFEDVHVNHLLFELFVQTYVD